MPNIRVDQDVYVLLQEHAQPFVDTPNGVLRRMLGLDDVDSEPRDGAAERPSVRPIDSNSQTGSPSPRRKRHSRTRKKSRERAKPGSVLPLGEYLPVVLEVLASRGGAAPARDVISEVGERLRTKLTETDHQPISSGEVRWQNRVQFARLRLVEDGLLAKDSPKGIWVLSEAGQFRAKEEVSSA